jgi:uncharacterized alkaline shock family protein YloU
MIDKEQILHYEIADTVLVNLVRLAAMEVPGVAGVSTSLSARFNGQRSRGITVIQTDDGLTVDIHIIAYYGENLEHLAVQVQQVIGNRLQTMIEPKVLRIDVTIEDLILRT